MTAQAYWIDAKARKIEPVEYTDYRDIERFVGGHFSIGWSWGPGHRTVLYVEDDGLFSGRTFYFRTRSRPDAQPIPGNGLVVGPDRNIIRDGHLIEDGNDPPEITIEQLREEIEFLTEAQADAWAFAMRDQAAMTLNGRPVMTWGQMWTAKKEGDREAILSVLRKAGLA